MSDELNMNNEELESGWEPTDIFGSEDIKNELIQYLQAELKDVIEGSERKELEEKWETWRRQRVARPKEKVKNTPWEGAANLASPASGSNTNGIYARVKNHIKRRRPLISVETDSKDLELKGSALERFVNKLLESPLHINFGKEFNPICYDTVSLGTQFVEIPWKTKRWQFKRSSKNGGVDQVDKIVYDGPVIEAPRLEDVLTRVHWWDIQTAPWIAFRSRWFKYELEQQQAIGFFENVEKILGESNPDLEVNLSSEQDRMGLKPDLNDRTKEYEIFRVYVFWDVDGNGITEDTIVWFEKESGTILRAEFNELGRRPIVKFPYFQVPRMLYAIGVGWMSEILQEEIDTMRNIRVNSTHISSTQMSLSRRGSGLPKRMVIGPAVNHEVDSPREDFQVITFPDVTRSTVQAEMMARQDLDRFTGAGDAAMGLGDSLAKSRATAGGTMFLAQRSDSILTSIIEDIESAVGEMALYIVMQLVANGERTKRFLLPLMPEADQALLREVMDMNVEDIPLLFRFVVKVTDEEKTQEARRQGILMLTKLYSMFGQEMMQQMMMILNPQVPEPMKEFATRIYVGRTKLMEETLRMFGEGATSGYVPYTKDLEFMLQVADAMREEALNSGGVGQDQAQGIEGLGGLGMVPEQGIGADLGGGAEPAGSGAEQVGNSPMPGIG
jgi:hypothetical protein